MTEKAKADFAIFESGDLRVMVGAARGAEVMLCIEIGGTYATHYLSWDQARAMCQKVTAAAAAAEQTNERGAQQ